MATKTHPAKLHVICKSMELFIVSTVKLKYQMEVDFSKTTAKPRIIQFRIHNLTVLIIILFPRVYGPCFWLQAGPLLSFFTIKIAKIWQNLEALYGAHWRVPTNFILQVSTLMLALLSYHWFVSRSGPTFEKIAFNFRYVTLCTFQSLVGGILEKS